MPKVSLKILESNKEITKRIHKALLKDIDTYINKRIPRVLEQVTIIARSALLRSPEIQSLAGGTLMADFGLTSNPGPSIVDSILSTLTIETHNAQATATNITGGFTIKLQPNSYGNLYSAPFATQAIKGGSLPWLKWLLELGDTIIILNYGVEYGPHGRTGMAHMVEDNRPFKVNSNYSGTKDNNFITRAFATTEQEITNAIVKVMK